MPKLKIEVEYDDETWPEGDAGANVEMALEDVVARVLMTADVEVTSEVFVEHELD